MPRRIPQTPKAAPDSPRQSQSPLPTGLQGDLELELLGLANALYNLGTTVINDSTKERQKPGATGDASVGKPVGQRVNDVIGHLRVLDEMAEGMPTMIPMQVLSDIDNSRNPMQLTKDRIERAATENQFMNGKIQAIDTYCTMLNAAFAEHFPELAPLLDSTNSETVHEPPDLATSPDVKMEPHTNNGLHIGDT